MSLLTKLQLLICIAFLLLSPFDVSVVFVSAVQHSPISYNALLVLVAVELVFAFSVGIICVIFSFNLFRALSDLETALPIGDLPSRVSRPRKTVTSPRSAGSPSLDGPKSGGEEGGLGRSPLFSRNPHHQQQQGLLNNSNSNRNRNRNLNSNCNSVSADSVAADQYTDFEEDIDIETSGNRGNDINNSIGNDYDEMHEMSYSNNNGGSSVLQSFTDYVKFW